MPFLPRRDAFDELQDRYGMCAASQMMSERHKAGTSAPTSQQGGPEPGQEPGPVLQRKCDACSTLEREAYWLAAAGTIDCNMLTLPPLSIAFGFSDGAMLKGIIGGTQGMDVHVVSFAVSPASRSYAIELNYVICDDFGVDTSDLYSPGLISFWMLQHERSGFVPFQNVIDLTVVASGSY